MKHLKLLFIVLLGTILLGVTSCDSDNTIHVSGISLDNSVLSIKKGTTKRLSATIQPLGATSPKLAWVSDDESIATVDGGGEVSAIEGGTTTITVYTQEGNFSANCVVTVTVDVEGISISESNLDLVEGENRALNVKVLPENATDQVITWSSSNSNVASVNSSGVVSARKIGTTTITAKTANGSKEAKCLITVSSAENIQYNPYGESQSW